MFEMLPVVVVLGNLTLAMIDFRVFALTCRLPEQRRSASPAR